MTYQQSVTKEMEELGKRERSVFLGQGIINGERVYGTLKGVPIKKCIEMPIAENLIVGAAIGLALEGLKPIVVFQRMDFMLIAADAIINHLSLMPLMSGGQFTLPVILRTIIGSRDLKFDVGLQHNHDFTQTFQRYIGTFSYEPGIYSTAYRSRYPRVVVEEKDSYKEELKENNERNTTAFQF